jgi:hypothetical protein
MERESKPQQRTDKWTMNLVFEIKDEPNATRFQFCSRYQNNVGDRSAGGSFVFLHKTREVAVTGGRSTNLISSNLQITTSAFLE